MDSTFMEWIVGQAGVSGLAAFAILLLNRAWQEAYKREKESAEMHRADKLRMLEALDKVSSTMARLETVLDTMAENARRAKTPTAQRRKVEVPE